MNYQHTPVLKTEIIKWLAPKPNQNFIDCTLGRGGLALEILKKIKPKGKVLGIDLDQEAIQSVKAKIQNPKSKIFENNLILVQDNFKNLTKIYNEYFAGLPIHGVLIDLGASSPQFDDPRRGFSFNKDAPLDMNFDQKGGLKADEIINKWSQVELTKIFKEYGEERFAKRIASNIVTQRKTTAITRTKQLAEIIKTSIPAKFQSKKIHPATKIFQALRIAVNDELTNLRQVLPQIVEILEAGGRVAIISFHSLEDRIVKQFFSQESKGCICPPSFPVCQCNHSSNLKILTKKPVIAGKEEVQLNPRARSAKLRVAEKVISN
jgi:16S rRNA (cytosine1402-N4)-methyltransferase